jgi:hypothetical protein
VDWVVSFGAAKLRLRYVVIPDEVRQLSRKVAACAALKDRNQALGRCAAGSKHARAHPSANIRSDSGGRRPDEDLSPPEISATGGMHCGPARSSPAAAGRPVVVFVLQGFNFHPVSRPRSPRYGRVHHHGAVYVQIVYKVHIPVHTHCNPHQRARF